MTQHPAHICLSIWSGTGRRDFEQLGGGGYLACQATADQFGGHEVGGVLNKAQILKHAPAPLCSIINHLRKAMTAHGMKRLVLFKGIVRPAGRQAWKQAW